MSETFTRLCFEIFESLPRQGPGHRASTARALALCRDLPSAPRILDLGCGVGAQTFDLAELTPGLVVAVDLHPPNLARLRATAGERGVGHRVHPLVGDMARPGLQPRTFDLVWSEGALYNIGLPAAFERCRELLRPGGHLAFTEAVWRTEDPPAEVRACFEDYPAMGSVADAKDAIALADLSLLGHFPLPDEAWWDDFYGPLERRIEALRVELADDAGALAELDQIAAEPALHRAHSSTYGYEFFVVRA